MFYIIIIFYSLFNIETSDYVTFNEENGTSTLGGRMIYIYIYTVIVYGQDNELSQMIQISTYAWFPTFVCPFQNNEVMYCSDTI